MLKKVLAMVVLALALWAVPAQSVAYADEPIKVFWNGKQVYFPDQKPMMVQNRVLIPIRALAELKPEYTLVIEQHAPLRFSYQANHNPEAYLKATFFAGKSTYLYSESGSLAPSVHSMPLPLMVQGGRSYISVRTVGELFGDVHWDGAVHIQERIDKGPSSLLSN